MEWGGLGAGCARPVLGGTDIHGRGEEAREDAEGDLSMLGLGQGWDSWCCNPPATGHCERGWHCRSATGKEAMQGLGLLGDDQAAPLDIWEATFPLQSGQCSQSNKKMFVLF